VSQEFEPFVGILLFTLVAAVVLLARAKGVLVSLKARESPPERFQFGLRSLVVVVAMAAMLLGVVRIATKSSEPIPRRDPPYRVPSDIDQMSFDPAEWRRAHYDLKARANRLRMVDDLVVNHLHAGTPRHLVIAMLGRHEVSESRDRETYIVVQLSPNGDFGCLRITFDSNDAVAAFELVIIGLPI
jgi:hypothetical protein